ncbi:MobQ family relaxase [Ancylobacter sp. FA202]|uniref:MobQ family relaxase n=1 Tax=Ancylobacter sp. FA202 TaxID=1111106 RepID=UPI0012F83F59|nr:MobQ family relaxase [Ancylobacter sp. FA202]
MASYHFAVQVVKRSQGRSVVAMAAYRAGERLHDSRRNQVEDYSKRRGVAHREIMAPEGSAHWLTDRESLWNAVEHGEKRVDAQLAREINMALPHELTHQQRLELVRGFIAEHFVSRGMVADFAIHEPVVEKGDNHLNHHAHILLSLRQATAGGLRSVKTREWNSDSLLRLWRAAWADHQNRALHRYGFDAVVDHRTLAVQRAAAIERGDRDEALLLDRLPEVHIGPLARQAGLHGQILVSREREVGPRRYRQPGEAAVRRVRKYPLYDRGSRLSWTKGIVRQNGQRARSTLEQLQFRRARLERKLAYWDLRAKYGLDGKTMKHPHLVDGVIAGRRGRPLTAHERVLQLHAAKRADLLRRLLTELGNVLRAARQQSEGSLIRTRTFSDWVREIGDAIMRDRGRELDR